uniref:ATP synthase F0 subunit 6 n=1 Tax=Melampus sincaporensis TaxID=1628046 RepID=UPI003002D553|nr:ATP synthase F0 subunit 6 [Melampus sincaporensis]
MMADLFSSLDGTYAVWSWLTPLLIVALMFSMQSRVLALELEIKSILSAVLGVKGPLSVGPAFCMSLMFMLVLTNLVGLAPFVYGPTSSLWFAGGLALLMWGLLILSGWAHSPKKSAAHLAPEGAPAALTPFLILIETVSIVIRPLTLTVRLVANISAGHIVLSLIANCLTSLSVTGALLLLTVSVGYNLFEIFVCIIQAYIFTLLISLYAQEHP